eukprot:symbB.v1.2.020175.t1/scaffold1669.1/size106603/1
MLGQSWICQQPESFISKFLLASVRATAFSHFCGGETLEDCVARAKELHGHAGVRCIVDWGVEESSDAAFWDLNAARKVETLQRSKEVLGSQAAFMPIKLTSLLSPALLERITLEAAAAKDAPLRENHGWQAWLHEAEVAEALRRLRQIAEVSPARRKPSISCLGDALVA